ncbi:hypothetical protein F8388_016607 [Cannabis sativa]|uniref:DUF4283 domain-containing protein n=1 Tax=Cannabis sativa TaxID=3483 RepID=A0A7J6FAS9_CANSA|nr:hypothetical protein F8388_016607 [Cannabis sativa]
MDLASSIPSQMFSVHSLLSISLSVCPFSSVCQIFSFCVMASSSRISPSHLALNEEEAIIHNFDGVSLGTGPSSESYCLVVKILSLKSIKPDWLDKAMREAWTLRYPVNFTEYRSGLFLSHFGCDGDRRRVIENQPWHFDHCLMVFANPEDLLAKMVVDDIGDLIEIHKTTLLEISGPFLRIRVLLDVSKPIRRGMQCGSFLQRCDDGYYPPVLPFKENIRAPLKSHFKRDPFDLANSIPFEEMNLRSLAQNHDLQDAVNQFLPQASLLGSQVSPLTLAPTDHQIHSTSPISSQEIVTSDSQFSGLQSLLCAVSQASLNEPSTIVHTDKGKGIQASDFSVPHFSPRALSIGGGSGTKRSFVRQEVAVGSSVRGWGNNSSNLPNADPLSTFLLKQDSCIKTVQSWSSTKQNFSRRIKSLQDHSQEGSCNNFIPVAPKEGSFKLLVDAAISTQLQKVGIGASVFDNKVDIVATMSSPCDGDLSPLLAEAKALLWALRCRGLNHKVTLVIV